MKNKKVFFVSPHLDDAVLSAYHMMAESKRNSDVTVINVFTEAGRSSTLSAGRFVHRCGFQSAQELFEARRREDTDIMRRIGVSHINLGYTDASWRVISSMGAIRSWISRYVAEVNHVYPIFRFHVHSRRISHHDEGMIDRIHRKLDRIIPEDAVIVCPLSLGDHIDHVIVRNICDSLKRETYYWTDYPYVDKYHIEKAKGVVIPERSFVISGDDNAKVEMIKRYHTQLSVLFPKGDIHLVEERYYHGGIYAK